MNDSNINLKTETLDVSLLKKTFRQLSSKYDQRYGGFGDAPKFPNSHNLLFLLRYWKRFGEKKALEIITRNTEWLLREQDKNNSYLIRREENTINVYKPELSLDKHVFLALRNAFEKQGHPISRGDTLVVKRKGRKWWIKDKANFLKYRIEKTGKVLNVYVDESSRVYRAWRRNLVKTVNGEIRSLVKRIEVIKTAKKDDYLSERDILQLRFFDELDYKTISDQLNIGLSATKMRLKRARLEFRNLFESQFKDL